MTKYASIKREACNDYIASFPGLLSPSTALGVEGLRTRLMIIHASPFLVSCPDYFSAGAKSVVWERDYLFS